MPAGIYMKLFLKVKKMKRYNMHSQMCVQNSKLRALEEKNIFAVKKAHILSIKALVLQEGVRVQ